MNVGIEYIALQKTILQQVYDVILDAICDGRLAPGERLTQDTVAKKLNVSRQPVGQALLLLKQQKFVCDAGRRGLMVAPVDEAFLKAVYEFRLGIDPLAAGLAARQMSPEAAEQGLRLVEAGDKAIEAGGIPALIAADMEFHMFIYRQAGNPIILDTMQLYWNHLRRAMREVVSRESYRRTIWTEHREILSAIAGRDAERAQALARHHLQHATGGLGIELAD